MEIRWAQEADAPGWAEEVTAVAEEGRWIATQPGRPVEDVAAQFSDAVERGDILLVLVSEGRIVGGIGIHPTEISGVHTLGMSILKEYRGQGWGRQLVEAALEEARTRGVVKVVLEVFPDNGRAISLYAGTGFEVEGYKRHHYPRVDGSRRSALVMARFL